MNYDCILFDLDGTLLYTLEDLTDAVNYALARYGLPLRTLKEVNGFVGNGLAKLVERSMPDGKENPVYPALLSDFMDYYNTHNLIKTRPYDGILEYTSALSSRGVKTAIVTNKGQAASDSLLANLFYPSIKVIVGDDGTRQHKPHPDNVNEALRILDVTDKSRVLYVGDSDVDARTGINAGIDYVLCTWGYKERDELQEFTPVAFIDSIDELDRILG